MGYEVSVFPDHWYLGEDNFKVKNIFSPKIFIIVPPSIGPIRGFMLTTVGSISELS